MFKIHFLKQYLLHTLNPDRWCHFLQLFSFYWIVNKLTTHYFAKNMEILSSYPNFDLIETVVIVNEKEEKDVQTKLIIDSSLETEDTTDNIEINQKTDKVLVFIQICIGLIVILCIIFGGFVLWHHIKSPNNVSEFTTVAAIDLQVCNCILKFIGPY